MTATISSLDVPHTRIDHAAATAYLRRFVITTLHQKGAEGAEAGVISEIERLLEHHVQNLFETARDYAQLAHRSIPNANDVLQAHASSSHSARKLRKESKRRKRPIPLSTVAEPPEDEVKETITSLAEAMRDGKMAAQVADASMWGEGGTEKKLDYAFDGAPRLPPSWTFPSPLQPSEPEPAAKVTSAALNFVKATVTEADIDPELGIVNYRKRTRR
ncbi:hypothetical protein DB88DRAFT_175659 [Papiliotrema laurentii]|uniref:Bromodomain associated domain-containing protein n=1 Tax=Papiliotrema laurentii TaxID=5418 RepID=A0AAD9L8T6_PAPLA|nr:hypothetical protein DB88DRAFT_175659 [Papiliotrema laurentii]